jgi:DNA repair exonuclease SbcCD nuclease subunit
MRAVILGDSHFGARQSSIPFFEYFMRFYNEVLFPYMEQNKIRDIIQVGDFVDHRKFINIIILSRLKSEFLDECQKRNINLHVLIGNHDIPFKNNLEHNSTEALLSQYPNITIYKDPKTIKLGSLAVDMIPWICPDNQDDVLSFINKSRSEVCIGHFELSGFEMDRGNVCHEGMDKQFLRKYEIAMSGHFHHRSTDGQIYYVGTPYQMTWADADDIKGFHTFDSETRLLEFVENPNAIFHKVLYDEENIPKDLGKYTGTFVKIIVLSKKKPFLFDKFVDDLMKVNPLDISILEGYDTDSEVDEKVVEEYKEDTPSLLKSYITNMELDINKDILYNKVYELYYEAQDAT